MGWVWLGALALLAGAGLRRLGVARGLWTLVAAALVLGAAGYARQGSPGLAGRPTEADAAPGEVDADLSDLRLRLFGLHTFAEPFFVASDALTRAGAKTSAVRLLLGAVNQAKSNAALWTALGSAYVTNDGTLSPAARLAFDQAIRLAPEHPGPPFFLGVGLIQSGDLAGARRWWIRAYRLAPAGTSYRRDIALRLVLLDQFINETR